QAVPEVQAGRHTHGPHAPEPEAGRLRPESRRRCAFRPPRAPRTEASRWPTGWPRSYSSWWWRALLLNPTPFGGACARAFARAGFINAFQLGRHVPQGLKPAFFRALNGTAEAVPYPKPIHETSSTSFFRYSSA